MPERAPKRSPRPPKDLSKPLEDDIAPEQFAAILDASADPLTTLREIAKEAGLPEKQAKALVERVRAQYQPVVRELKKVHTTDLQNLIDDRVHTALEKMDLAGIEVESAADAKNLAVVIGILLEKRQLLRGEPTAILGVEERRNLNDLIPALVSEAKRRGMEFEVRGPMVDVTPRGEKGRAQQPGRGKEMVLRQEQIAAEQWGEPE